jgi:hypothetical protein
MVLTVAINFSLSLIVHQKASHSVDKLIRCAKAAMSAIRYNIKTLWLNGSAIQILCVSEGDNAILLTVDNDQGRMRLAEDSCIILFEAIRSSI